MAHLIRKYSFPPEKDMLKPPTLVDPVSTAWYRENAIRKTGTDPFGATHKDRVLTGTDVVSARITDSYSPGHRGTLRKGLSEKYAQYTVYAPRSITDLTTKDLYSTNSKYPASPSKPLDLYGPSTKHTVINRDMASTLPSRTNDVLSVSNTPKVSSPYVSTYSNSYQPYGRSCSYMPIMGSAIATTTSSEISKEIKPLESSKPRNETPKSSASVPSIKKFDRTDLASQGSSYNSDEYYMKKIGEILNVHSVTLFNASPAQVTDYMYIGGYRDAENWQNLKRLGITHVLNMAALRKSQYNPYPPQSGITGYEAFDADDHEMYNVMQHYPRAKVFIDRARWGGGKVLVHCAMGVNRSGAMCCAYLMTEQKMNMLDAMRKLKQARGTVLCNRGFQKQLIRLARQKGCL